MIKCDENALICDMAETYKIYDYKRLPPLKVAIFALGLKSESRIKMKLSGAKVPFDTSLMMAIFDRLNLLLWAKTSDAEKGRNKPKSIFDSLVKKESDVSAFISGEDFEKERQKIINQQERRALDGD